MEITLEDQVKEALEDIRPNLQADGGDVQFLGIEDDTVQLRLMGACGTCPSSTFTLKMGIEAYLKKKIPSIKGVVSL